MTVEEKPLPPFTPLWGRQHPWMWSTIQATGQGLLLAGLVRYEGLREARFSWLVGGVAAAFSLVLTRIFVNQVPWQPRWMKGIAVFNVRKQPRWIALILPIFGFTILASHASGGSIDGQPLRVVWSVGVAAYMSWMGYLQWRYIDEIRAVAPSSDRTGVPVPPPEGIWPGLRDATGGTVAISGVASPLRRLGARVLDAVVVFLAASVVAGVAAGTENDEAFGNALLIALASLWAASEIFLVALKGQTLGKIMAGIRVATSDEGDLPNLGRAFVRWFALAVFYVTIFLGPIASAWLLWDKRRQTLYDKAAGTVVLRVQKAAQPIGPIAVRP
jgi:uncharacterized RDD family membrane protein YckC